MHLHTLDIMTCDLIAKLSKTKDIPGLMVLEHLLAASRLEYEVFTPMAYQQMEIANQIVIAEANKMFGKSITSNTE